MQWSLSYSQNTTNYTFFPRRKIQVQKWDAHTHTCTFTQTKWQWVRGNKTDREKNGGEREKGHVDRVMVADTEVHSAVRVRSWGWNWRHRPGSVCRCPLTAPLTFIPPPLPHCPSRPAWHPPIGLRGGGGTAGLHQRPGAVRGSGPDAGTQQSLTQERDREGAETDSFKKAVQTHPFSEKGISRTKHFILLPEPALCQLCIQQPRRDSFPPRSLFSLPLVSFFQRLQPMAPLSVWTREII